MAKFVFIITIFCLAFFLGCAASKNWWEEPPQYDDAFVAVGAAMQSRDTRIMRQQAELDGRRGIARIIEIRIQETIKDWAEQNQSSLHDKATFNESFESVGEGITSQDLSGAWVGKWQFDEKSKTQYALVVFKKSDAAKIARGEMEKAHKKYEEQEQEKPIFTSREEAERAFKELDELIEEQLGL